MFRKRIQPTLRSKKISHDCCDSHDRLVRYLKRMISPEISNQNVIFFCIGSINVSGDCFGPLVGSFLKNMNYDNVIGTMDHPVHALNLKSRLEELSENKVIIAIDAGLGLNFEVGAYLLCQHPIQPGSGLGNDLPLVGDCGILGIVNELDYKEGFYHTPIEFVQNMAKILAIALAERFPHDFGSAAWYEW